MESRYIWAIAILLVWITLRVILMYRRRAQMERWLKEREAEEAQQRPGNGTSETLTPDAKSDSNLSQ